MTTLSGLPAHALLVHFIVILAPLTAGLAILCAVWRKARQRLVWLVVGLAGITVILTPFTTHAGEWLRDQLGQSPLLKTHAELGDTMGFFSLALLIAAVLLAVIHVRELRGKSVKPVATWIVAAVVIVLSLATTVQVYRIGDSGAKATWTGRLGGATQASTP